MTKHVHRDEIGTIRVNGRMGAVVEWLRWASPLLLTVVLATALPFVIWTVNEVHELHEFRVLMYEHLDETRPADEIESDLREAIHEEYLEYRSELNDLRLQVARMEERLILIQRILEDR